MVISIFKIVAIADLTHFSQERTVFRGFFFQIFFLNDGNILVFSLNLFILTRSIGWNVFQTN